MAGRDAGVRVVASHLVAQRSEAAKPVVSQGPGTGVILVACSTAALSVPTLNVPSPAYSHGCSWFRSLAPLFLPLFLQTGSGRVACWLSPPSAIMMG
jgi:hypothetical protein